MFEISDDAIIAGNISTDNEAGLQIGESSDVQVWNNTVVNNEYAFSGYQGIRAQPVNIQVRNNILGAGPTSTRPVLINFDVDEHPQLAGHGLDLQLTTPSTVSPRPITREATVTRQLAERQPLVTQRRATSARRPGTSEQHGGRQHAVESLRD